FEKILTGLNLVSESQWLGKAESQCIVFVYRTG
ncbi:MAG: integrase, partial [Nitrospirae bacterium CG_4_10_14_0_8_um_filter_41_23]